MTIKAASYEPIVLDPTNYVNQFAEWKHPNNVAAQEVCKYNTFAMFANTALVSTVVSVALACFSNWIVLGLVLTAASGLAYVAAFGNAMSVRIPLNTHQRVWIGIEGVPIAILRCCYSAPKVEAARAEDSVDAAAATSGFRRGREHKEED